MKKDSDFTYIVKQIKNSIYDIEIKITPEYYQETLKLLIKNTQNIEKKNTHLRNTNSKF